jgi:hypothetical protein
VNFGTLLSLGALILVLHGGEGLGTFFVGKPTDAVDQPESQRVVDHLEKGRSYPLLKVGGPGQRWCKLRTPSGEGWVICAQSGPSSPVVTPPAPQTGPTWSGRGRCATRCNVVPLFQQMPALSAADREVLQMCPARPDASVSRGDVERFFRAHVDDPRIQRALSRAGRSGNREEAVAWLTDLWVGTGPRNAFTHVFCGDDWTREKIGGLHWLPRYVQLEQEKKVCYAGPARRGGPLRDGIYFLKFTGVSPWSCGVKDVGGFTEDHDPVALISLATRAFVRCCPRDGRNAAGVYQVSELGGQTFRIACGTRNGTYGIASFYPVDDLPTCGE